MLAERRHFQRVGLNSPLPVRLDESKDSLLFDLCEEGLAVDGLADRKPGEVIPFSFELPERHGCIQGTAEIVWTNDPGHRTGLHVLGLADPIREQLVSWISARACAGKLVVTEKVSFESNIVTDSTPDLINPILQHLGNDSGTCSSSSLSPALLGEEFAPDYSELRSAGELNPDRKSILRIAVGLGLLLLFSVFVFLVYQSLGHSRETRNNLQTGVSPTTASAPELPPNDAAASVKNPSAATPPFAPPAPLDHPGFVLQVGAMRHEANADSLAQDLQRRNFPAFVFRRGTDRFYRVAVGPYSEVDSPARVKGDLQKNGLKSFLRPWVPE
jgi:hypothetical protein